jgi:hypothetical protein
MYISRSLTKEYPFTATFYTIEVDEGKPLDQIRDEKVVILETECDITEASHSYSTNFISAKYSVYFPFDPSEDEVPVRIGHSFEAEMYGIRVNGKVVGVFPSQMGGVTVYIQDTDA